MLGIIIGDIAGSRFEFRNHKGKDFEIFHKDCEFTDDSVMTLAIAKALIESKEDFEDLSEKTIFYMKEIGRPYRDCGYGGCLEDGFIRMRQSHTEVMEMVQQCALVRVFLLDKPLKRLKCWREKLPR